MTVHGGYEYAESGESFSFDRERLAVEPCTRVSVTFVNGDSVRHQWTLHGLPTETYPMGMFNVEVSGPGSATGDVHHPRRGPEGEHPLLAAATRAEGDAHVVVGGDGGRDH